jgi:hypothetical protein
MGDALRRVFLSIGVALGLVSGQPDPVLHARLFVDGTALAMGARIENAFAPGARELVEDGTHLALRFEARLQRPDGSSIEARETRTIWYDMRQRLFLVGFDGGKTAALADPGAAMTLVAEPERIGLGELDETPPGTRVLASAAIGIVDARGAWHDAPVLWNYSKPRAVLDIRTGVRP